MIKNKFEISYKSIKGFIVFIAFSSLVLILLGKVFPAILDFSLNDLSGVLKTETNFSIWIIYFLLISFWSGGYILYLIIDVMVSGLYYLFSRTLYNHLTSINVNIPITNQQVSDLKDKKLFYKRYLNQDKPEFNYDSLREWGNKVIEKEIQRLTKGKK